MFPSPRPAGLLSPGSGIGRYREVRPLSEAARAAAYEVEIPDQPGRWVAKVLALPLPHPGVEAFGQAVSLKHAHLTEAIEWGVLQGVGLYVVYERLEGHDLARELGVTARPLSLDRVLLWIEGPAAALADAHALGVAHLDVRPERLFLERSPSGAEVVKLLGLGASARWMAALTTQPYDETAVSARYVAPEQLDGRKADGRADVFALAAITYEALAGHPPFSGPTLAATLAARFTRAPADLRQLNPAVSAGLERVILRGLAVEPSQRPRSPIELLRELRRAGERTPLVLSLAPPDTQAYRGGASRTLVMPVMPPAAVADPAATPDVPMRVPTPSPLVTPAPLPTPSPHRLMTPVTGPAVQRMMTPLATPALKRLSTPLSSKLESFVARATPPPTPQPQSQPQSFVMRPALTPPPAVVEPARDPASKLTVAGFDSVVRQQALSLFASGSFTTAPPPAPTAPPAPAPAPDQTAAPSAAPTDSAMAVLPGWPSLSYGASADRESPITWRPSTRGRHHRMALLALAALAGTAAVVLLVGTIREEAARSLPPPPVPTARPAPVPARPAAVPQPTPVIAPATPVIAQPAATAPRPALAAIDLRTNVSHASLKLDGRPAGRAPLVLRLPPGRHTLELTRPGYARATRTFEASADQTLRITLHRLRPSR